MLSQLNCNAAVTAARGWGWRDPVDSMEADVEESQRDGKWLWDSWRDVREMQFYKDAFHL